MLLQASDACVFLLRHYSDDVPINVGSGAEVSIADFARIVAEVVGYEGRLVFDTSKPNGQPRRRLDVSKAQERFGFHATMSFDEGLRRTVEWYLGARVAR